MPLVTHHKGVYYVCMTKPKTKGKTINLSLSSEMHGLLKEMAEHFKISSSEIIRRGIETQKEIMLRQKFGYKGETLARAKMNREAKDLQREDQINSLRTMSAQEFQSHLEQIGYFTMYNLPDNIHNEIVESPAGVTWVQKTVAPDGAIISRREVFTLDEIIGDLKKNKLI